ncbi:DUF4181 domain-containing protein [Pontibacillus yanchengensis]|uniref:DUF4181 domain-containing protein n=1 Tax=Pontibacillus yanchengensis Y32 TaxID=1385514 RepID=A0A0A2TCP5_9BACI|nr:DUF4181 domain-containing protein [Pontibacillus yanchengensis]KGP73299.1 hypothetical protein N782_06405 [Pontibacillus yanchengensis Y32]
MDFIIFLIIVLVFFISLEKLLRKRLGIQKQKISNTPGKKVYHWGKGVIVVVFLCCLPYAITLNDLMMRWFWIGYLSILLGFEAFIQWKYIRDSK